MSKTTGKSVLLQSASILVLTAGAALAKGSDQAAPSTDEALTAQSMLYAQVDTPQAADDENVEDYQEGEVGARELDPDDVTGEDAIEAQTGASADDDMYTGPEAADDESVEDYQEGAVGAREDDMEGGLDLEPVTADWQLEDFKNRPLYSETGEMVGTVQSVAYDDGDDLYLVVDLSPELNPIAPGPRAIPLTDVGYERSADRLQLDALSVGTVEAMADYNEVQAGYDEIETDAKLQELLTRVDPSEDETVFDGD